MAGFSRRVFSTSNGASAKLDEACHPVTLSSRGITSSIAKSSFQALDPAAQHDSQGKAVGVQFEIMAQAFGVPQYGHIVQLKSLRNGALGDLDEHPVFNEILQVLYADTSEL
jgi:hypothetical protein